MTIPPNKIDGERDASTVWAEERTDWAEDRTILAVERTFAGWMRTGLAALVVALGLQALFGALEPLWLPRLVASSLALVAIAIFWSARNAACRATRRLDDHAVEPQGTWRVTLISGALSGTAAAIMVIFWLV